MKICSYTDTIIYLKGESMENQMNIETLDKISRLYKVLGDSNRLKVVYLLKDKEMCVHELTEQLKISQSLVSHQLKVLRDAKIVKTKRQKNHIYYSLDDEHIVSLVTIAKEHIEEGEK